MKLYYLGTCSGTEPIPDMHHVSWILETGGVNYWFEAGENAAYRAFTMGVDVMKTVALFVSHPHIDHIGGLPNLLACIQKMEKRYSQTLVRDNTLKLYFPDLALMDSVKQVACGSVNCHFDFHIGQNSINDGLIFEDNNIRVFALHNTHLKETGENGWHSYSFLIEAENKRIVFSGDVGSIFELDSFITDCDMLIMETGHHKVEDVLQYATDNKVSNLRFIHHGRQIIENPAQMEHLAAVTSAKNPICVRILRDGETELF